MSHVAAARELATTAKTRRLGGRLGVKCRRGAKLLSCPAEAELVLESGAQVAGTPKGAKSGTLRRTVLMDARLI